MLLLNIYCNSAVCLFSFITIKMSLACVNAMKKKRAKKEEAEKRKDFKFDIGNNIFVIISKFNGYINIGIRECRKDAKSGQHYPMKNGISLMLLQYDHLVVAAKEMGHEFN